MDQQRLWKAFLSGEEAAFSQLFFAYYARLYDYGCKLVRNEELVKDVVQDFFLYLLENREGLTKEVKQPIAYLLASFRRLLLRERKQRSRARDQMEDIALQSNQLFVITVEDILILEEENEHQKLIITGMLNDLPPRQREILYLKYYLDLSLPEISEALSISYQVVANHLYRALKKLRGSDQVPRLARYSLWSLLL